MANAKFTPNRTDENFEKETIYIVDCERNILLESVCKREITADWGNFQESKSE
jgi:hypothetical protein